MAKISFNYLKLLCTSCNYINCIKKFKHSESFTLVSEYNSITHFQLKDYRVFAGLRVPKIRTLKEMKMRSANKLIQWQGMSLNKVCYTLVSFSSLRHLCIHWLAGWQGKAHHLRKRLLLSTFFSLLIWFTMFPFFIWFFQHFH